MKKQLKNLTVKAVANTQQIKGGKSTNDVQVVAYDNPLGIDAINSTNTVIGG